MEQREEQCVAVVPEPPHYFHRHRCTKRATKTIGGVRVCGIHARVAQRWNEENRLHTMVEAWWTKG